MSILLSIPSFAQEGNFSTLKVNAGKLPNDYKMAVNGGIITDEVHIQLEEYWPDYVFDQQYALLPLEELAAFIAENRHLPGLAPASEVEAEGHYNVGKLSIKLLEKVEELTLYTIAQHNQKKLLETQIAAQEKRLKALENTLKVKE